MASITLTLELSYNDVIVCFTCRSIRVVSLITFLPDLKILEPFLMMSSLFDFSWILLFQTFFRKVSWVSDFCDNYPWNFLLTCSFSYFQENINEIDQQIKAKESEINTLKDEAASLKTEQQEIVLELQERKKAVKDKQVDIIFVHCAITRSIGIPPLLRKWNHPNIYSFPIRIVQNWNILPGTLRCENGNGRENVA